LLTAAGLKWVQAATIPILPGERPWQMWGRLGLIEFEVLWGIWLWGGVSPRLTRKVSAVLFLALAAISAARGVRGDASCGCFGEVSIHPWLTFALDIGLALGLGLGCVEGGPPAVLPRRRVAVVVLLGLAMSLPVALLSRRPALSRASVDGEIDDGASYVVLDPARWRGKRLPLLKYLPFGGELGHGRWNLLVYRRGCEKCDEAVGQLARATDAERSGRPGRWALIELPPMGRDRGREPPRPEGMALARLDSSRVWIAEVPFTVVVVDGVVE
jgi:hypothetical protein